nr:hypothetical protein [Heliorestis convoluta]
MCSQRCQNPSITVLASENRGKKTSSGNASWLSVEVGETSERDSLASPLVIRVGQAVIEVKPGFDPALLTQVVRTLKTLC